MLHNAIKGALPYIEIPGLTADELEDAVLSGEMSFLFDEDGEFIIEPQQEAIT